MTVNTVNIISGPYAGNGVTTEFSYTFRITNQAQLRVLETASNGIVTELTIGTDYTVQGVGNAGGGTITRLGTPIPTGTTLLIRANYVATQNTAFNSQGGFFPDLHENAVDKLTYLVQQIEDRQNRTLRLSDAYTGALPLEVPSPVAGRYLRWNSALSGFDNVDVDGTLTSFGARITQLEQGGAGDGVRRVRSDNDWIRSTTSGGTVVIEFEGRTWTPAFEPAVNSRFVNAGTNTTLTTDPNAVTLSPISSVGNSNVAASTNAGATIFDNSRRGYYFDVEGMIEVDDEISLYYHTDSVDANVLGARIIRRPDGWRVAVGAILSSDFSITFIEIIGTLSNICFVTQVNADNSITIGAWEGVGAFEPFVSHTSSSFVRDTTLRLESSISSGNGDSVRQLYNPTDPYTGIITMSSSGSLSLPDDRENLGFPVTGLTSSGFALPDGQRVFNGNAVTFDGDGNVASIVYGRQDPRQFGGSIQQLGGPAHFEELHGTHRTAIISDGQNITLGRPPSFGTLDDDFRDTYYVYNSSQDIVVNLTDGNQSTDGFKGYFLQLGTGRIQIGGIPPQHTFAGDDQTRGVSRTLTLTVASGVISGHAEVATEQFTQAEKTKLGGIASGAEVNTAVNIDGGAGAFGVFRDKTGNTLNFRELIGTGSASLSIDAQGRLAINATAGSGVASPASDKAFWTRLSLSATDPNNDMIFSAGRQWSSDGSTIINLNTGLTKQKDVAWAAGNNQGGRLGNTALPANGVAHNLVISNDDGTTVDAAFIDATQLSNIVALLPTGFTRWRSIHFTPIVGGNFVPVTYNGDTMRLGAITRILLTAAPTPYAGTHDLYNAGVMYEATLRFGVIASATRIDCAFHASNITTDVTSNFFERDISTQNSNVGDFRYVTKCLPISASGQYGISANAVPLAADVAVTMINWNREL